MPGANLGTQYRSIILTRDTGQEAVARQVIAEMASAYDDPIVTEVRRFETFYKAEDYHQYYYLGNPGNPIAMQLSRPGCRNFANCQGQAERPASHHDVIEG